MKRTIRLNESELRQIITESVRKVLKEGCYDYPDGIDEYILLSENDGECYDFYWKIVEMLKKKFNKGINLSSDVLANSSVMKKYQQFVFRKFRGEQHYTVENSPYLFRKYIADRIIERINTGEY